MNNKVDEENDDDLCFCPKAIQLFNFVNDKIIIPLKDSFMNE